MLSQLKKFDMSIGQCAEGYRTAQLLKNLGIADEGDDKETVC